MSWVRHEKSSQVHSTQWSPDQVMEAKFSCSSCAGQGKPEGSDFGCGKCGGRGFSSHYRYFDVPEEVYLQVRDGESVGRALNELVKKGGFKYERLR